jgi:peroxiredoxin/outer membrane lipoprotein-sorting protein
MIDSQQIAHQKSLARFLHPLILVLSIVLGSTTALGDDAADQILKNSLTTEKTLVSLTAQIELTVQTPGQPLKRNLGTVKLMKPNYVLLSLSGDYPLVALASDGQSIYLLSNPSKYSVTNAEAHGENIDTPWWTLPMRFFFTQDVKPFGPDSPPWISSRYVGSELIRDENYDVVEITGEKPRAYVERLYFDSHKLLRRSVITFGKDANAAEFTAEISRVNIARHLGKAEFKFTPPANALLDTGAESRMLSTGEIAPNFSLPTPDGETLTLANFRRGKKATLVSFWFIACPPCREEFQLFQQLHNDLKDRGLAIVAINKVDEPSEIKNYFRKNSFTFATAIGERDVPGVFAAYHVEAYPSTYLLDADGKIVYRAVGFHKVDLLRQLAALGLPKQ